MNVLPDEEHEDHKSVGDGYEGADFDAEEAVETASGGTTLLRFNNNEGLVHQYQIYMIGFNFNIISSSHSKHTMSCISNVRRGDQN